MGETDISFHGEPEPLANCQRVGGVLKGSFATVSSLNDKEEFTTPPAKELVVDDDDKFAELR